MDVLRYQPEPDRYDSSAGSRQRRRRTGSRSQPGVEDDGPRPAFRDPLDIDSRKVYARGRYRASQASRLLMQYGSIRGELITAADRMTHAQQGHADLCREHLERAKEELESRRQKLSVCANLLALADRELVNMYPPEVLRYRVRSVRERLLKLNPVPEAEVAALFDAARRAEERPETPDAAEEIDSVQRTALRDALTCIHDRADNDLLADDLQVTRLCRVMSLVGVAMLVLLVAIPFVSTRQLGPDGQLIWPIDAFTGNARWDLFISALGLAVVGAVGGVVSGMLSVRDTRADLGVYRTSMLKVYLRPLAGAISALVLYLFLSAEVVSGVEVTNGGVYVVAAFLAGFSERYFLRILRAQEQSGDTISASRSVAPVPEPRAAPPGPAPHLQDDVRP